MWFSSMRHVRLEKKIIISHAYYNIMELCFICMQKNPKFLQKYMCKLLFHTTWHSLEECAVFWDWFPLHQHDLLHHWFLKSSNHSIHSYLNENPSTLHCRKNKNCILVQKITITIVIIAFLYQREKNRKNVNKKSLEFDPKLQWKMKIQLCQTLNPQVNT